MKKTYYLLNPLREELGKIWGVPFFGSDKEVIKKFKNFCRKKKFKKVITVGDYCSKILPSSIKIFDGKIERNKPSCLPRKIPKGFLRCSNPPASINKEVWGVLKKALSKNKNVFVEGEEDLLVIPGVLLAKTGEAVVYGLAGKGIGLIEVSPKVKREFQKLLGRFGKEKFKKIVMGGTFNGLHSGHRYLLTMAGYYAKEALIGLCSDKMVKVRKKGRKDILSFKERKEMLENYLKKIGLKAEIVEINNIYGPAAKDEEAEAILLTEETFLNGRKINSSRKKNNLKELHYIVLPYLLNKTGKKFSNQKGGLNLL